MYKVPCRKILIVGLDLRRSLLQRGFDMACRVCEKRSVRIRVAETGTALALRVGFRISVRALLEFAVATSSL